jgi:hypothetical protein
MADDMTTMMIPNKQQYPSPLRYPGGKTKLANFLKLVMLDNDLVGAEYVEPYSGGAGVALSLLFEDTPATSTSTTSTAAFTPSGRPSSNNPTRSAAASEEDESRSSNGTNSARCRTTPTPMP